MADELDRAAEISAAWTDARIAAHQQHLARPGTLECEVCEEPIPEPRRRAQPNATRCLACQEAMEKPRVR